MTSSIELLIQNFFARTTQLDIYDLLWKKLLAACTGSKVLQYSTVRVTPLDLGYSNRGITGSNCVIGADLIVTLFAPGLIIFYFPRRCKKSPEYSPTGIYLPRIKSRTWRILYQDYPDSLHWHSGRAPSKREGGGRGLSMRRTRLLCPA